jgi:Replicative DNA helicase
MFSLEMDEESLMSREICRRLSNYGRLSFQIDVEDVREQFTGPKWSSQEVTRMFARLRNPMGKTPSQHFQARLGQEAANLSRLKFHVDDRGGLHVNSIRSQARIWSRKTGLDLVVIDYLQLIHGTPNTRKDLELAEVSQGLKEMAKELDIAIVLLAQLNRQPEQRGGLPKASDIREAGAAEQDADVVALIAEDEEAQRLYEAGEGGRNPEDLKIKQPKRIIIGKNRNGETRPQGVPVWLFGSAFHFDDRTR